MVAPPTRACDESDCDCQQHESDSDSETSSSSSSTSSSEGSSVNVALLVVTTPSPVDKERQALIDQIIFVETLDELHELRSDVDVQLAVWRREQIPGFVTQLSDPSFDTADLPAFQGVVTPESCLPVLTHNLCGPYHQRSNNRGKRALSEDSMDEMVHEIEQLVRTFSEVSGSDLINVKLAVFSGNGCQYWHQDSVPMRLIVTYRGPCTEFVPPTYSRKTLRRRKQNSTHAQSLSHHDVALFQGKGESSGSGKSSELLLGHEGIVHRSPRIEGEGIDRLVLVLDVAIEGWHY